MDLQRSRLFLLVILFVIGFFLYQTWQAEHPAPLPASTDAHTSTPVAQNASASDIPTMAATSSENLPPAVENWTDTIEVTTDVLKVNIDPVGGDIVRAELIKYPQTLDNPEKGVVLLDKSANRFYIAQSGLSGKDELGPDSRQHGRAHYQSDAKEYTLTPQEDFVRVDLKWKHPQGIIVNKSYIFRRNNYLVDVNYHIHNPSPTPWEGSIYGQLRQEYQKEGGYNFLNVQMYQGGAMSLPEKPYKKVSFSDMQKQNVNQRVQGGWAAMVEHYFLAVLVPPKTTENQYFSRVDKGDIYNIGATRSLSVPANSDENAQLQFYIGPEVTEKLKEISPGLNKTVDYGILWPISEPLFWLLKNIHDLLGNWGWSIVVVTILIKLAFFKLSAASYRSMGLMRKVQPKIEILKQRYGNDKQQFSMAMMELYKKEKINPLGGCLPILIQIPVFIALYYVLLASVELRQAPFILWIQDLSARDPYFVLPLIMGITMFVQQKMNPPPPDPIQAKVMMAMPIVFTALFLSFPAGLVLYWTVNNILSIAQQWMIMRSLDNKPGVMIPKKAK